MEKQPKTETEYEKYEDRNSWATNLANKLEVKFTGEYFEVPIGEKEVRRIRAWKKYPLYNDEGEQIGSVKIETAIKATQKFPEMNVQDAIKKLQSVQSENTGD